MKVHKQITTCYMLYFECIDKYIVHIVLTEFLGEIDSFITSHCYWKVNPRGKSGPTK